VSAFRQRLTGAEGGEVLVPYLLLERFAFTGRTA
jgi:hypothetical protein